MRLKDFMNIPYLDAVILVGEENFFELLSEGKWISGRFDRNIRIDQPTHGVGQTHAHILGRKGHELGVVNLDGTGSHGTKIRLTNQDAASLTAKGFKLKAGNIVEWIELGDSPQMLFG